jgi:hypothetical protein
MYACGKEFAVIRQLLTMARLQYKLRYWQDGYDRDQIAPSIFHIRNELTNSANFLSILETEFCIYWREMADLL